MCSSRDKKRADHNCLLFFYFDVRKKFEVVLPEVILSEYFLFEK